MFLIFFMKIFRNLNSTLVLSTFTLLLLFKKMLSSNIVSLIIRLNDLIFWRTSHTMFCVYNNNGLNTSPYICVLLWKRWQTGKRMVSLHGQWWYTTCVYTTASNQYLRCQLPRLVEWNFTDDNWCNQRGQYVFLWW
jgi:hypothetical protein